MELNCTVLFHIELIFIVLHWIVWHGTAYLAYWIALYCLALHCIALNSRALYFLCCIAFHRRFGPQPCHRWHWCTGAVIACSELKIISIDMKGRRVLPKKISCQATSIPLRCCQPPIQKFAKYRAIFVSIQMLAKYRSAIFGRFWFWIFTLPSALLILGTDFEVFAALLPSVMPETNSITVLSNWRSDFHPVFKIVLKSSSSMTSINPFRFVFEMLAM